MLYLSELAEVCLNSLDFNVTNMRILGVCLGYAISLRLYSPGCTPKLLSK